MTLPSTGENFTDWGLYRSGVGWRGGKVLFGVVDKMHVTVGQQPLRPMLGQNIDDGPWCFSLE